MRNNLITVNSCKEHNEDISIDDEYVRNIITMITDANHVAYKQFLHKTIKSLKRKPALLNLFTKNKISVNFNGIETEALEIDRDRVDLVMKKIAYAIFYHKYHQRWLRRLIIVTTHLKTPTLNNDEFGQLIEKTQQEHNPVYEGSNPDVFKFIFLESDKEIYNKILRMKFYDGFEIWVFPDEEAGDNEPELATNY